MTCRLQKRLLMLTRTSSPANGVLTIFHPRCGRDTVRITLSTDPEILSGNGTTICEAVSDLEEQLNLLPPDECGECQ